MKKLLIGLSLALVSVVSFGQTPAIPDTLTEIYYGKYRPGTFPETPENLRWEYSIDNDRFLDAARISNEARIVVLEGASSEFDMTEVY